MNFRPTTITISDPRQFDGDPYQVAERAIQQLQALLEATEAMIDPTNLMLRNAELERQMALGVQGDELREKAQAWPENVQAKRLADLFNTLESQRVRLEYTRKAAKYDPKAAMGGRGKKKTA